MFGQKPEARDCAAGPVHVSTWAQAFQRCLTSRNTKTTSQSQSCLRHNDPDREQQAEVNDPPEEADQAGGALKTPFFLLVATAVSCIFPFLFFF